MTFYDAMNQVLQTPPYDWLTGRRVDTVTRMMEQFLDFIDNLFSGIDFEIDTSGAGYNLGILSVIFVAVAIVLLIVTAVVLFLTFRNRRKAEHHDLSDIFEELARKNYTVTELIKLSDGSIERRLAIRYRYIATILALNEKQIIEIKPSATNAIILRQIKATAPNLTSSFEHTAHIFHLAWFGYKEIHDQAYEDFTKAVNSILVGGDNFA